MKKDKKTNEWKKVVSEWIEESKGRYQRYSNYLSDEFYRRTCQQLENMGSMSSATFKEKVDNLVNLELAKFIQEGNIDLEIQLIEENRSKTLFYMKKMGINGPNINHDLENYIMKAIETYQGDKLLSLHIIQCVKDDLHSKNIKNQAKKQIENNKKENQQSESHNQEPISTKKKEESLKKGESNHSLSIVKKEEQPSHQIEKKEEKNFSDLVDQYIKKNKIDVSKPTILEKMFQTLVVFSDQTKQDSDFLKFIYLKYGYHGDIYFSKEDIRKILNKSKEEISSYYIQSLILLKGYTKQSISYVLELEKNQYSKK